MVDCDQRSKRYHQKFEGMCDFYRMVRPIGGLKVVEVWRGSDMWVKSRQEKPFNDFRNIVQIGNRAIVSRDVRI